jgi:hypothetical protein
MANKSIIQLVADVPAPDRETTEKYYRWLEDVHCPDLFKYKGIRRRLNCRQIDGAEILRPIVADYPEYLSINEFYSKKDMGAFTISPEFKYASKDTLETWGDIMGREKKWLVAYEETKTFERKPEKKGNKGNRLIHIVAPVLPPDPKTTERFYKWLDGEHIPQFFEEFKGIAKATNYRRIGAKLPFQPVETEYPYLLTVFEYFSRTGMEEQKATVKARRPPADADWGTEGAKIWLVTYEVVKSWER